MSINIPVSPPRISVAMSVFNGAAYLKQAIESVLNQTYVDFEFLIHDDGSTDDTLNILNHYAKEDSRVIISSGSNIGVPAAINRLIKKARGEFIARFDADDICMPYRFEQQIEMFEQEPSLVALGSSLLRMDEHERLINIHQSPLKHEEIDALNLRGIVSLHQPSVMMRKSALLDVGGYDESYMSAQDHELWLRLAEVGKLANIATPLIKYRIHPGSISGSKRQQQRENCLRSCKAAWKRRGVEYTFDYQNWRMEESRGSKLSFYLTYAWQAWQSGFLDTWKYYSLKAIRLAPWSIQAWKALVFGYFKRSTDESNIPE